jgi:tRNA(adenine34) deaminase
VEKKPFKAEGASPFPEDLKLSLMREALKEAEEAFREGEVPAGALVCSLGGEVISRGRNSVISLSDPSAHAEVLALRRAGEALKNYRLTGLALFSTLEPCAMCLSCALMGRLRGLVYALPEPKWGAHQSLFDLNADPRLNHHLLFVESGVLMEESRRLMADFFRARRKSPKG